jgi:enoyl-CoA hydratase/carnithine racemase
VTFERRDRVAVIRFATASRVNPLSIPLMREIIEACRAFDDDGGTAAAVVTGRSDCFSAGLDLRSNATRAMAKGELDERRALAETGRRMLGALAGLAPVTIAAIEGPCLGGGLALAAALDFRIAGRAAVFGAPEVGVGLSMGWGSLAQLSAVIGVQAARRLVLAGERLDASQALQLGFVDRMAEDGDALGAALGFASRIAAQPVAPLRMAKRALGAMIEASGTALALDTDQFVASASSEAFAKSLSRFAKG